MTIIKEVILQLFFTLMPFLIFNVYYRDKAQNYSRKFIIITSMTCLFISMTFGASTDNGFFYDIRYVIQFFGLLFGGLQAGFILLAEFLLYRLYLGGKGIEAALMAVLITFPFSLVLYRWYRTARRKTFVILLAGTMFSVTPLLVLYFEFQESFLRNPMFYLIFIPIQNLVGCWLLISLFQKAVKDKELFIKYVEQEKVEMIGQVAASLVHEVRNPLTAVKGFLKLIRESSLEREKVNRYIDICVSEMERTEFILSEYLSISKPLTDHKEPTDLSNLLQITTEVMRPYANMNNVGLEANISLLPVWILANPEKIKQILMNMIKNAIEACYESMNGKVFLELLPADGKAILTIEDNGIGMTKDQIDKLGGVFFSTKSRGTGLGLNFSYQAIQAMGGSVSLNSVHREGTRFTITLPVYEQAQDFINAKG